MGGGTNSKLLLFVLVRRGKCAQAGDGNKRQRFPTENFTGGCYEKQKSLFLQPLWGDDVERAAKVLTVILQTGISRAIKGNWHIDSSLAQLVRASDC